MVDGDSMAVAQENYVRLRTNNGIEAVYLFLSLEYKAMQGFARDPELTLCEQVRYGAAARVDTKIEQTSSPGLVYRITLKAFADAVSHEPNALLV